MRNLQETFGYDLQNRLTEVRLGSVQTGTSAYGGYGRMTAKTADGQAVFSNAVYSTTAKPHAMDAAETLSGVFPSQQQNISYTCFDKVSQIMQGNKSLNYTYDDRGFIASRTDTKVNQTESYYYDELDRLESYTVNGVTAGSIGYDHAGNILTNSKVGTYRYGSNRPHAVNDIEGSASCPIPSWQCNTSYNLRNRPASISENGYSITLDYSADGMRRNTRFYSGSTLQKKVIHLSELYEKEVTSLATRHLDYIYAEGRVVALHVKNGNADSLYYVLTDHLGSWNKVMRQNKTIVQQTHFDPWGNRMDYTRWDRKQATVSFPFRRGFTGHEHYDRFKVVNANARLYDPVIGRFFSPDPFVQAPDFTQNFNRYSYCMNNPVMYSDPDGEFLGIPMLGLAFIGRSIANLIDGVENPFGSAWQQATDLVSDMDQCMQFSIPLGENTSFNFGLSPLSFSVNAGFTYYNGSNSVSFGGGYGIIGPYGYMYGSQDIGFANLNFGFGIGNNYYGWNTSITRNGYGIGYGRTFYGNSVGPDGNPNPQITGTPSIYFGNGSFRLENDYFGDRHDRWRTNAWELTIGNFTLGSTIYTNDPKGMGCDHPNDRPSPIWGYNRPAADYDYGAWNPGFVYSCPLWIGWRIGNNVSRIGYSHQFFQDLTQNGVHKYLSFGRQNFYLNYGQFEGGFQPFGGYYNPFSLYY